MIRTRQHLFAIFVALHGGQAARVAIHDAVAGTDVIVFIHLEALVVLHDVRSHLLSQLVARRNDHAGGGGRGRLEDLLNAQLRELGVELVDLRLSRRGRPPGRVQLDGHGADDRLLFAEALDVCGRLALQRVLCLRQLHVVARQRRVLGGGGLGGALALHLERLHLELELGQLHRVVGAQPKLLDRALLVRAQRVHLLAQADDLLLVLHALGRQRLVAAHDARLGAHQLGFAQFEALRQLVVRHSYARDLRLVRLDWHGAHRGHARNAARRVRGDGARRALCSDAHTSGRRRRHRRLMHGFVDRGRKRKLEGLLLHRSRRGRLLERQVEPQLRSNRQLRLRLLKR